MKFVQSLGEPSKTIGYYVDGPDVYFAYLQEVGGDYIRDAEAAINQIEGEADDRRFLEVPTRFGYRSLDDSHELIAHAVTYPDERVYGFYAARERPRLPIPAEFAEQIRSFSLGSLSPRPMTAQEAGMIDADERFDAARVPDARKPTLTPRGSEATSTYNAEADEAQA